MNIFTRLSVFLWQSRRITFVFAILIPLLVYLQLSNMQFVSRATIKVEEISLQKINLDFLNYPDISTKVRKNEIFFEITHKNSSQAKARILQAYEDVAKNTTYIYMQESSENVKKMSKKMRGVFNKLQETKKESKDKKISVLEKDQYKQKIAVLETVYEDIQKRYKEALLKYEKTENIATLVEIKHYDFNVAFCVFAAFIFAIIFSLLLHLLKEKCNRTFKSAEKIREETSLKALEGMPKFSSLSFENQHLISNRVPLTRLAEMERIFKYVSRDCNVIEVVSSANNEGNSSLLYALAQTASIGHKVLIVDMNLRNMDLTFKLDCLPTKWGMDSEGRLASKDSIKGLGINLDFLPALTDVSEKTLLRNTQYIKNFLDSLKKEYDYIFIDTTSISSVNIHNIDSVVLSSVVDGVILNYLANRTLKSKVYDSIAKLNMANARILGIVTNNRYNPKVKDEFTQICMLIEKFNKPLADKLRVKVLKSYIIDEK